MNRRKEKLDQARNFLNIPNSFSNYKLYTPLSEVGNNIDNETKSEDSDVFDRNFELDDIPRVSPRPAVLTWKQKEVQNAKVTAQLVERKRKSEMNKGWNDDTRSIMSAISDNSIDGMMSNENEGNDFSCHSYNV